MTGLPGTCRSCEAPIRWARSDSTGKLMPLDPGEDPAGIIAVRQDVPGGELRFRAAPRSAKLAPGEKRATSHFATCPNAATHRKA